LAAQLAEPMDGQEEEDGAERAVGPTLDLDGMRAFKTEIWEQLEYVGRVPPAFAVRSLPTGTLILN
jgi:hypothetical protein